MKKLLLGVMFLALAISVPIPTMAGVSIQIGIPLPPPVVFPGPPEVVLLPNTGVYVAPDIAVDLFFFDGWWWRPWEGRWYRSQNYRSGWVYYDRVPSFYGRVPPRWREDYREHRWNGREWHYQRVTHPELQRIYRRNVREQSRTQPQMRAQPARPQPGRAEGRPEERRPEREMGRPPEARPEERRPGAEHGQPPHGGPGERR